MSNWARGIVETGREMAEEGGHGLGTKVYLRDLWKRTVADHELDWPDFADVMLHHHRQGDLRLSRADLSPVLDRAKTLASEILPLGPSFPTASLHFLETAEG